MIHFRNALGGSRLVGRPWRIGVAVAALLVVSLVEVGGPARAQSPVQRFKEGVVPESELRAVEKGGDVVEVKRNADGSKTATVSLSRQSIRDASGKRAVAVSLADRPDSFERYRRLSRSPFQKRWIRMMLSQWASPVEECRLDRVRRTSELTRS